MGMRCLYCGNELALLKKLTGGGEFCSEAHRQKYQEEYNRLALSRLLQAQPAAVERATQEPLRPSAAVATAAPPPPRPPVATISRREAQAPPPPASPPPPEPGFIVSRFEPVLSPRELFSSEPFLSAVSTFLPGRPAEDAVEARLATPNSIGLERFQGVWNSAPRSIEKTLEPREFLRSNPILRVSRAGTPAKAPVAAESLLDVPLAALIACADQPWYGGSLEATADPAFRQNAAVMVDPYLDDGAHEPSHELLKFDDAPVGDPIKVDWALIEEATPARPEAADQVAPVEISSEITTFEEPEAKHDPAGPEDSSNDFAEALADVAPGFPYTGEFAVPETPEIFVDLTWLDESEEESIPAQAEEALSALPAPLSNKAAAPLDEVSMVLTAEGAGEAEPIVMAASEPLPGPARRTTPLRIADRKLTIGLLPLAPMATVAPVGAELEATAALVSFKIFPPALEGIPVRPKMFLAPRPKPAGNPPVSSNAPEPVKKAEASFEASKAAAPKPEAPKSQAPKSEVIEKPAPRAAAEAAVAPARETWKEPTPVPEPRPNRMGSSLDLDELRLNLEQSELSSPLSAAWSRMGMGKRVALGAGFMIALFIAGVLLKSTFASKGPPMPSMPTVEAVGPGLVSGAGGWTSDWNGAGPKGRQISMFRPSLALGDYRIEFQGQIESTSIGWVFRAVNPKNYYATRLEMTKAGLEPSVVLAHYAVINGEETQRTEIALPFKVQLDTVYKVRTDVFGSEFRTYIQEKLVDDWADDRLKTGGFGLLNDPGDRAQIRMVQLHELNAAK